MTAQAETRDEALVNLDAVDNDSGRPPTDEKLPEADIDPEQNRRSGSGEPPDILE